MPAPLQLVIWSCRPPHKTGGLYIPISETYWWSSLAFTFDSDSSDTLEYCPIAGHPNSKTPKGWTYGFGKVIFG